MANPNPDIENIRPYQIKPGEVRNPNGYSRSRRLTDALIKAIEEQGSAAPFVELGIREALNGDFRFWKEIFNRVDGLQKEEEDEPSVKPTVIEEAAAKANARKRNRKSDGPSG